MTIDLRSLLVLLLVVSSIWPLFHWWRSNFLLVHFISLYFACSLLTRQAWEKEKTWTFFHGWSIDSQLLNAWPQQTTCVILDISLEYFSLCPCPLTSCPFNLFSSLSNHLDYCTKGKSNKTSKEHMQCFNCQLVYVSHFHFLCLCLSPSLSLSLFATFNYPMWEQCSLECISHQMKLN